jgi:hypothetical protein
MLAKDARTFGFVIAVFLAIAACGRSGLTRIDARDSGTDLVPERDSPADNNPAYSRHRMTPPRRVREPIAAVLRRVVIRLADDRVSASQPWFPRLTTIYCETSAILDARNSPSVTTSFELSEMFTAVPENVPAT